MIHRSRFKPVNMKMKRDFVAEYKATGKIPFHMRVVQGAIGKEFVIKHYGRKRVVTKYPDMTKIIASKGQRACRDLFRDAVTFAMTIIKDKEKKLKWKKRLNAKPHRVFN